MQLLAVDCKKGGFSPEALTEWQTLQVPSHTAERSHAKFPI
jgi:hypothetical protein